MIKRALIDRYRLLVFLLLPFLLSWPAWFNGQPFFFPDTTSYIKGGASAVELLVKTETAHDWLHAGNTVPAVDTATKTVVQVPQYSSAPDKSGVISGRSIYYGLFLFLTACVLSLKFVALIQALLATMLISSILRERYALGYRTIAVLLLALAVASPLPYFASMLMPDIFAGLGIASAIALILMPAARPVARLLWGTLVLAAALFHSANIMILLATIATLVIVSLLFRRDSPLSWKSVGLAFVLVAGGVAGEAAFSQGVQMFTDTKPIRPPFITARLLADGPGNAFVKSNCPQAQFEVCNYARDFTKASSDDFLWSVDPAVGVFTPASRSSRALLGQQDFAFAKAVFTHYPMVVLKNSARNIGAQLGFVGLEEYVYDTTTVRNLAQKIPTKEQLALEQTRAAKGTFDVSYSATLIRITSVAALLVCLAGAVQMFQRKRYGDLTLIGIFLLALLINAGVCGALSTPHDRYQARIIWILQLMAMLLVAARMKWVPLPGRLHEQDQEHAAPGHQPNAGLDNPPRKISAMP